MSAALRSRAGSLRLVVAIYFAIPSSPVWNAVAAKLPYFPNQARELTRRYERMIVAGIRRPVAFFGYPGLPSYLTTEEQTVILAGPQENALDALAELASEVNAPDVIDQVRGTPLAMPKGVLDAQSVSAAIARLQPVDCIVMAEVLAAGVPYFDASKHSPRFTHLMLTGGAIGQGPNAATGAAIACPNRKVINFQSDGCGAYSVQAFWTQAREDLDVVTIIGSNRCYQILEVELLRAGVAQTGPIARSIAGLGSSLSELGEDRGRIWSAGPLLSKALTPSHANWKGLSYIKGPT
jgi:acetolactate synthase I/II/III large subunit